MRHQFATNRVPVLPMDFTRQITGHEVNEANSQLTILADDPKPGYGASHHYVITKQPTQSGPAPLAVLDFQNGPIPEVGVNGVTHEALITILIDRLEGFQSGPYACAENARAIERLTEALKQLEIRTVKRQQRGVEGTHTV